MNRKFTWEDMERLYIRECPKCGKMTLTKVSSYCKPDSWLCYPNGCGYSSRGEFERMMSSEFNKNSEEVKE